MSAEQAFKGKPGMPAGYRLSLSHSLIDLPEVEGVEIDLNFTYYIYNTLNSNDDDDLHRVFTQSLIELLFDFERNLPICNSNALATAATPATTTTHVQLLRARLQSFRVRILTNARS